MSDISMKSAIVMICYDTLPSNSMTSIEKDNFDYSSSYNFSLFLFQPLISGSNHHPLLLGFLPKEVQIGVIRVNMIKWQQKDAIFKRQIQTRSSLQKRDVHTKGEIYSETWFYLTLRIVWILIKGSQNAHVINFAAVYLTYWLESTH